jgi:hypothetical protein
MSTISSGKNRWGKVITSIVFLGVLTGPFSAFASTVLPSQVLPPQKGAVCAPITFSDIQAHVYNGNLDSFDVTVSDPTYVAVSTTVNGKPVAFNYITRWSNPDGSVKTHVDLQSIRMNRDVPVQMTFLSAHRDQSGNNLVTCIFNIPATIAAVTHAGGAEYPTSGQTSSTHHVTRPSSEPTGGKTSTSSTATPTTSTRNPGIVGAVTSLGNLCVNGGATRLWVVLLVLFALFCFTLCVQKFEVGSSVRDWNIGLILAVFVGLLIFWYVSAVCRTGAWAPALATGITIIALLYTMLKSDDTQEILLLKDGKK